MPKYAAVKDPGHYVRQRLLDYAAEYETTRANMPASQGAKLKAAIEKSLKTVESYGEQRNDNTISTLTPAFIRFQSAGGGGGKGGKLIEDFGLQSTNSTGAVSTASSSSSGSKKTNYGIRTCGDDVWKPEQNGSNKKYNTTTPNNQSRIDFSVGGTPSLTVSKPAGWTILINDSLKLCSDAKCQLLQGDGFVHMEALAFGRLEKHGKDKHIHFHHTAPVCHYSAGKDGVCDVLKSVKISYRIAPKAGISRANLKCGPHDACIVSIGAENDNKSCKLD